MELENFLNDLNNTDQERLPFSNRDMTITDVLNKSKSELKLS